MDDDVWVAAGSIVLDGTHIERGAVIGAGSLVRGVGPANSVWTGVPARQIRDRR